jgi:hypothetical protein
MEAARTSETLVNFYQTTGRNDPDDSHLEVSILIIQRQEVLVLVSAVSFLQGKWRKAKPSVTVTRGSPWKRMEHASLVIGLVLTPFLMLFVFDGETFETVTRCLYKFDVRNIVRKVLPQPIKLHVG